MTIISTSGSKACSEAKNKKRKLTGGKALARQKSGDAFDLVFKYLSTELGYVEIGLSDDGPNGTKLLNEKGFKTPRMMKVFISRIVDQFTNADVNNIKIVGFIINGKYR